LASPLDRCLGLFLDKAFKRITCGKEGIGPNARRLLLFRPEGAGEDARGQEVQLSCREIGVLRIGRGPIGRVFESALGAPGKLAKISRVPTRVLKGEKGAFLMLLCLKLIASPLLSLIAMESVERQMRDVHRRRGGGTCERKRPSRHQVG
jgi:hypothetical protein